VGTRFAWVWVFPDPSGFWDSVSCELGKKSGLCVGLASGSINHGSGQGLIMFNTILMVWDLNGGLKIKYNGVTRSRLDLTLVERHPLKHHLQVV
jgi:hypothetical protein